MTGHRTGLTVRKLTRATRAAAPVPSGVAYTNGVVAAVTAGGSVDGKAQVTVTCDGSDTFAPYLDSYLSPAVGDVVRVQFVHGSPLILGRVVGMPAF